MDYIIGIDAGGTKTTAQAYTPDGKLLASGVSGFGNLTVDFEKGLENIKDAIKLVENQIDGKCTLIVLGCAGIETGDKKARALASLEKFYSCKIHVTNDAMLALYSALEGEDGILIIAGTGSIGYLKQRGEIKRFGGWGHLINDDGSGYTIVVKAIRYITYSFDTNNSETSLKKAFFEHLGISELKELIDFTYKATKGEIAALVPVVVQTAQSGDLQAYSILKWAGERLAYLAIGLCRQYNVLSPKIAISGSVIKKVSTINDSFRAVLDGQLDEYAIYDNDFSPAKGAIYIQ